jgi:hypothetical protein
MGDINRNPALNDRVLTQAVPGESFPVHADDVITPA